MASQRRSPLIVIVGPTASGKSDLAMQIARQFNGEIICADSRTVYKGMDIGTAKPSTAERAEIRHHILDVIEPDQRFTAAEFKRTAQALIEEITARGKLPIMVGGTGLYIDGVIYDYAFLPAVHAEEREALEQMSTPQLHALIGELGIGLPENSHNRRHLIRRIETNGAVAVRRGLREDTLVLGMEVSREELQDRLEKRTNIMLAQGLEDEVMSLVDRYGWSAPGLSGVGYREWRLVEEGAASREDVASLIIRHSMQYAKRQRTWFRRNQSITWIKTSSEGLDRVQTFLRSNSAK